MTGIVHKALVKEIASNKPNALTAFSLPDSATAPARSFDSALASGEVVPYHANNGTDWEDGLGTFTAGTPDILTRSQILDSSTGSAIDFSSGADVVLRIVWPASIAAQSDMLMRAAVPGGRLTLSSGNPNYQPVNTIAVSGQDTGADTITVTAHGWTVGTMVKSSATSGGLTAGTQYYAGNVTTNTISLHTTLASALAGTSKVDITGTVTANITANGVANTTIYYTPYYHNLISLWDGLRWRLIEFSEVALALGTLTSGKPYDIFAYLNAGVLSLELLEWTSDTVRATNIALQDGRLCKSGDKTRLLLGILYTSSTTSTENSLEKMYMVNLYNKEDFNMDVRESAASWTYSTNTDRQVNGNSSNRIDFILPFDDKAVISTSYRVSNSTSTTRSCACRAALDSTTFLSGNWVSGGVFVGLDIFKQFYENFSGVIAKGKHYIASIEIGGGADTQTWYGSSTHHFLRGKFKF